MGYNTTVVVLNDALDQISKDQDFGKNLAQHIMKMGGESVPKWHLDAWIPSGNHCNVAEIVEQHHADFTTLVAVGGNCGTLLGNIWGYRHNEDNTKLRLLEELAKQLGYKVVKKGK
ncbi:hypothetical protein C4577_06415 [Candidatus Parcubacteria bacterium]|nr:MAG: hypothetical protein C4577_06415 [Candidatus Parcubacteria bacterium]